MKKLLCLLLFLAACGGDDPVSGLGTCPTDPMGNDVNGRRVSEQRCRICHSSTLTGAQRNNAPAGIDFDRLDVVRIQAAAMYTRAAAGTMPPGGGLSAAEIENLRVWLACGAPDVQ